MQPSTDEVTAGPDTNIPPAVEPAGPGPYGPLAVELAMPGRRLAMPYRDQHVALLRHRLSEQAIQHETHLVRCEQHLSDLTSQMELLTERVDKVEKVQKSWWKWFNQKKSDFQVLTQVKWYLGDLLGLCHKGYYGSSGSSGGDWVEYHGARDEDDDDDVEVGEAPAVDEAGEGPAVEEAAAAVTQMHMSS